MPRQPASALPLAGVAVWTVFLVVVVLYELVLEHHYVNGAIESAVGLFGLIGQSTALVSIKRRDARQHETA